MSSKNSKTKRKNQPIVDLDESTDTIIDRINSVLDNTEEDNSSDNSNESMLSIDFIDFNDDDDKDGQNDSDLSSDSEISVQNLNKKLKNREVKGKNKEKKPNVFSKNSNIKYVSKSFLIHTHGYLKIITGCMFSGKTSHIIRECKQWKSIGKNVLVINYDLDKRYTKENKVVSHDQYGVDCVMIREFNAQLNKDIVDKEYDVILVNEAQFFNDLRKYVKHWCDDLKKIVVVSGLDGDYLRNKFGEILELIPDCDEIIKLNAYCSVCQDGTPAIFTWKTKKNPTDVLNVVVDIGVDDYIPLCRKHYNEERRIATQKSNNLKKL